MAYLERRVLVGAGQDEIGRLQVRVHHAEGVHMRQRVAELAHDTRGVGL